MQKLEKKTLGTNNFDLAIVLTLQSTTFNPRSLEVAGCDHAGFYKFRCNHPSRNGAHQVSFSKLFAANVPFKAQKCS